MGKNRFKLASRMGLIALFAAMTLSLGAQPKQTKAETADPPERIVADFEDGTVQGWVGRGGVETLRASAEAAHSGAYGLEVTGRTQGWHGPQLDVTRIAVTGKTYTLSAWLRLPANAPDASISMTVQRTTDGSDSYEGVASAKVTAGAWVKVTGQYPLVHPAEKLAVYFESSENPALDFYLDDVQIERQADPVPLEIQRDIPSLKDVFAGSFKLGAAVLVNEIADPDGPDAQLLEKHFNSLTAGNELKWDATEPREGQFDFTRADRIVDFAVNHGIAFRGHTLVWHSQTPSWVFRDDNGNLVGKEVLFQRMKRHIDTVVGRYKGKVYAWDVVNEVLEPGDRNPGGLRNSLWYQIAGEEYIEKAFEYAHEADPDAKLFINDYNTNMPDKRQFLHDLIQRLRAKGIPVDGVGHQTHIGIEYPSMPELDDMIEAFRDLNIEQQITELDMSVYTSDTDAYDTFPLELQLKQANRYKELFEVFKKHRDQITSVTFWGKDDLNTWLRTFPVHRNNWPLLFDERLQAKYAYWALVDPSRIPVETKQASAPAGRPKIDGEAEVDWKWATSYPVLQSGRTIGQFKALWKSGTLYVNAEVSDSSVNADDRVEVFVDRDPGRTSASSSDMVKYTFLRSGGKPPKPEKSAKYDTAELTGGAYRIEAAIPYEEAATGRTVGFDVRLTDRDGGGTASWNDPSGAQDDDPSRLGVLTLTDGPQIATAKKGTPRIDGTVDSVWKKARELSTGRWVAGAGGATAQVRVLWDAGHLYVLAEVTDAGLSKRSANPWEQDSVEVFLDPNNGKTDVFEADDGQYRINFANEISVNPEKLADHLVSAVKRTATGYLVEAAIAWPGEPPKAGAEIGFDVQVNDDANDDGVRDSIAIWNDRSGLSYRSTSQYGLLQLK